MMPVRLQPVVPATPPQQQLSRVGLAMQPACEPVAAACGVRVDRACCADASTRPVARPQAKTIAAMLPQQPPRHTIHFHT
jgi:hypothetical protein